MSAAVFVLLLTACSAGSQQTVAPGDEPLPSDPPQTASVAAARFTSSAPLPTPTLRPDVTLPAAAVDAVTPVFLPTPLVTDASADTTLAGKQAQTAARQDAPLLPCDERVPKDALLTVVTQTYGLSKAFAPQDLVDLADYLPYEVTAGYPTQVRRVIIEPLVRMIEAMQADGLHPQILSGYRSYPAQAIAWDKWNRLYPDRAAIISARPGHSEHQLGTVLDFGSPELAGLVGQPDILFHTYFVQTSEGQWLAEHANEYGFTLSYTLEAFETTGFYYEPWHYRYVGEAMAALLRDEGQTLTEYQLATSPEPCLP
ncbi:MAG: D-alanyl-D-alanine carboxypeptidase family protein [Candidatus Promineifilaceae bacterium]